MSPTLIADQREYEIRSSTWDGWKRLAQPFESPDDVLVRLFASAGNLRHDARGGAMKRGTAATRAGARAREPKRPKGRARVASRLLLPESEYELPILQILRQAGGRAPTREVIESVGGILDDRLTDLDKAMMSDGRTLRWQNRAQFARLRLVKDGLLKSDSPRGVWEIAPAGEERLRAGN